jgi:hypothetical protein
MIFLVLRTIWKASAINANDPTRSPTPSSRTKKAASMASITVIRVDFDHAILEVVRSAPLKSKGCLEVVGVVVPRRIGTLRLEMRRRRSLSDPCHLFSDSEERLANAAHQSTLKDGEEYSQQMGLASNNDNEAVH